MLRFKKQVTNGYFLKKIKKIKKNKPISRYRFVIFLKMLRFKKQFKIWRFGEITKNVKNHDFLVEFLIGNPKKSINIEHNYT